MRVQKTNKTKQVEEKGYHSYLTAYRFCIQHSNTSIQSYQMTTVKCNFLVLQQQTHQTAEIKITR